MGTRIIAIAFLLGASVNLADAAWEKYRIPEHEGYVLRMEFAHPGLGYALVITEYSPYNLLVYRNGAWTLERLPGMFLGDPWGISLSPSGYGWITGIHLGMTGALYTARTYGGGTWHRVPNPYENTIYEGSCVVSVADVEDVWILYSEISGFLHYKEGRWEEIANVIPAELGQPFSMYFVNDNDGWLSGENGFAHYQNGKWTFISGPRTWALQFTAANDGWATGTDGSAIYHYDGSSWRRYFTVTGHKNDGFSFSDRNNGWAVFYKHPEPSRLFKFESGTWREVKPPDERGVGSPCSISPTDAHFLGAGYSYRWYSAPQVVPTSLGKIKTIFK